MIDMHAPLETDEATPKPIIPNRRYWPNPVSLEYCGRVGIDGPEHWWDDEGQPIDGAPAIRNAAARPIHGASAFLDQLLTALIAPDWREPGDGGRFAWLAAAWAQFKVCLEENADFRSIWQGDDPSAADEAEREVEDLLKKVGPLLAYDRLAAFAATEPTDDELLIAFRVATGRSAEPHGTGPMSAEEITRGIRAALTLADRGNKAAA